MVSQLSLPDPRDDLLERSPLKLVVCQVRHDNIAAVADASRALEAHKAIEDFVPRIDPISEKTVQFEDGPSGVAVNRSEGHGGWRYRSEDETWIATIAPTNYSIETSSYTRWSEFRDRLARLSRAVSDVMSPKIEQRLGLRFVDEIHHPAIQDPLEFRGFISNELLGPLSAGPLSESVRSTQGLIEIAGPDGISINLRHGSQPSDNAVLYLLDHDCFRQAGQGFDVDEILETSDRMHQLAKQVFQSAITNELYEYLRGGVET